MHLRHKRGVLLRPNIALWATLGTAYYSTLASMLAVLHLALHAHAEVSHPSLLFPTIACSPTTDHLMNLTQPRLSPP